MRLAPAARAGAVLLALSPLPALAQYQYPPPVYAPAPVYAPPPIMAPAPVAPALPPVTAAAEYGVVGVLPAEFGGVLPLHASPGRNAPVIGQARSGDRIRVLRRQGGWLEIATPDGRGGWARRRFFQQEVANSLPQRATPAAIEGNARVTASALAVRTGPGTGYRALGSVRQGETVQILNRSGGWAEIAGAGIRGWSSLRYLDLY